MSQNDRFFFGSAMKISKMFVHSYFKWFSLIILATPYYIALSLHYIAIMFFVNLRQIMPVALRALK